MGYYISNATNNTAKSGGSHKDLRQAIWAVFHHKRPTDKQPDHLYCPHVLQSWCPYRRAEAAGTLSKYKHKNNIDPACMEKIRIVFEELTKDVWLKRLCHDFQTSRNEAYHSKMWGRCSKVA